MKEKTFFHNALEADLLSGSRQKRRLDAALGRTRAKASVQTRTNVRSKGGIPRWVYIPAVAVLLVLTLALGSVVIARGLRDEQHQAGQPTADHTPVEVPKQVVLSNSAEVRLLNEIDNGALIDQARTEELHLPAYCDGDWDWLRETRASVADLSATASEIRWTTELRVSKDEHAENPFETLVDVTRGMPLCFFYAGSGLDTPDVGAQLVAFASPGEIRFGDDGDDWIVRIPEICAMPQVYDQFPAALPPIGEVTIKNTMQILDRAGESAGDVTVQVTKDDGTTDEVSAALLGTIEHTFTFDAEVLLNIAEPVHIDVPLSGEYVLSIHENNGFHNEHVDLSGVTLDAEIHYTVEGVVVILSIKDAAGLSDVEQEALYLALSRGPDGTGDLPFAAAREVDSSYRVYPLSRTFWGTTRFARYLIAIDPSEYDIAKGVDFFGNLSYAVSDANGEPHEDWSWNSADGALPDLLMDCRQLPTLSIPLPSQEPTPCPPTEEPDPEPMLDEATLCTTWMLAEVEAPDGSSGDARGLGLERYLVFRSDGTVRIIDAKAPSEQVVPYMQNGNTVRFDDRVLRYDSEYNELVEIDSSSQDILFFAPAPNAGIEEPDPTAPQDDKVAICVYFYDGDADDAINEQFKAQYPELYNAFMYTEWGLAPQVQLAIQMKAQIADAYFTEKNHERCLTLCAEDDILYLSSNDTMCIIRVPREKLDEIRSTPGVTHIEIFEDMTSAASVADSSPLSLSAALSELLETEAPETVVNIQFYFSYGSALEDAFLYDGKTLTDYRNQPALRARSNEYEGWYYNEYRKLDEQNRDTPGWEKHDPEELFDAYWRERHTEEEIRAHEQAFEAYKKALNAFSEWRDGEGGQEAFRTILQQECDRLNALGFSLHVTEDRQIEGTATVKQLLDFPAKDGYHYWISLVGDESPIDE